MIQEFLKQYKNASNLDNHHYDQYFHQNIKRADFLLFDRQVICEVKEIRNINVKKQVEKAASKDSLGVPNFKKYIHNSIKIALSSANKQIKASKKALRCPNSLGLIVIENRIKSHLSIVSLLDASQSKLFDGLENTDGVLCIDIVNEYFHQNGCRIMASQLLGRFKEKSDEVRIDKLEGLIRPLMEDFCRYSGHPIIKDLKLENEQESWKVNENNNYTSHSATLHLQRRI